MWEQFEPVSSAIRPHRYLLARLSASQLVGLPDCPRW